LNITNSSNINPYLAHFCANDSEKFNLCRNKHTGARANKTPQAHDEIEETRQIGLFEHTERISVTWLIAIWLIGNSDNNPETTCSTPDQLFPLGVPSPGLLMVVAYSPWYFAANTQLTSAVCLQKFAGKGTCQTSCDHDLATGYMVKIRWNPEFRFKSRFAKWLRYLVWRQIPAPLRARLMPTADESTAPMRRANASGLSQDRCYEVDFFDSQKTNAEQPLGEIDQRQFPK
jgi:hypothetical protein